MEEALNEMTHKQEQTKYQEVVKKLEADILGRTVFVTNVRDLNRAENLVKLNAFMEQMYGVVEKCERAAYGGRRNHNRPHYPAARVRFAHKSSAERIFQGRSLQTAKAISVSCRELGVKNGDIRVQPSQRYDGMTDDELKGDKIVFDVQELTMGHWCPPDFDTYVQFSSDIQSFEINKHLDEFVKELTIDADPDASFFMTLDLKKRNVEIATRRQVLLPDLLDTPESLIPFLIQGLKVSTNAQQIISFRFKELRSHMEAFIDNDYLLFGLKWPPKLYDSSCDNPGEVEHRTRDTHFLNAKGEDFGRCRAFQVRLSQSSKEILAHHDGLAQLRQFGVLAKDVELCDQPLTIRRRDITYDQPEMQRKFDNEMSRVQSTCHPEIGTCWSYSFICLFLYPQYLFVMQVFFSGHLWITAGVIGITCFMIL
jgi:hypothetical protein